ncbi:MAG: hypothetical protein COB29_10390 [Sulfitobacter sp.]|nr:hypothetical protein [Roseobacter sp.]PHR06454.1 MAG: hypothetical protein COB29_10390 [Sulfitobacter sp.]|tara:strand:+ start:290 stop:763 length:474 start_codon:yes stop_codon:yes gene_type:complete
MTSGQIRLSTGGTVSGTRSILRLMQRLVGVSLLMASSGLWLAPGANWNNEVMLMKMALSAISLLVGVWLILSGQKPAAPEIQIDTVRRVVRLVRPGPLGADLLLQKCRFSDLSKVKREDRVLRFWDEKGDFIADVYIGHQSVMDVLISGLLDSGQAV